MKKRLMFLSVALMVCFLSTGVVGAASMPKSINIGTHRVGSLTNVAGTALASVISKHSQINPKVKAVAGPTTWLPMMLTKEMDFGIFTSADSYPAYLGQGAYKKLSKGKGFPIRLAFKTMILTMASVVPGDNPAKSIPDLKGMRVTGRFSNVPSAHIAVTATLANGGLTWKDVKMVPVPSPGAAVKAVMEGRADAGWASLGMPAVRELSAKKGARFLTYDTSAEAMGRKDKIHPYSFPRFVKGGKIPGAAVDTWFIAVENYGTCRADIPDDLVYEMNKTLWDNLKEYWSFHRILRSLNEKSFASTKLFIPYHPGAIKFLKEKGLWSDKLEVRQNELLGMKK